MKLPYEILIRFDDAGVFQGGHTVLRDSDSGQLSPPASIGGSDFPWPDVVKDVNTALAAKVSACEDSQKQAVDSALLEAQAKFDELVKAGEASIQAGDMPALATILDQAKALTSDARKAAKDKQIADLQAQIDALQGQSA